MHTKASRQVGLEGLQNGEQEQRGRDREKTGILQVLDQTGRKGRKFEFGCREPFLESFWSPVKTEGTSVEVRKNPHHLVSPTSR